MASRVVSQDGRRTFFEGVKDDAEQYIADHFPRTHVEPGLNYGPEGPQADVKVVSDSSDDKSDDKSARKTAPRKSTSRK